MSLVLRYWPAAFQAFWVMLWTRLTYSECCDFAMQALKKLAREQKKAEKARAKEQQQHHRNSAASGDEALPAEVGEKEAVTPPAAEGASLEDVRQGRQPDDNATAAAPSVTEGVSHSQNVDVTNPGAACINGSNTDKAVNATSASAETNSLTHSDSTGPDLETGTGLKGQEAAANAGTTTSDSAEPSTHSHDSSKGPDPDDALGGPLSLLRCLACFFEKEVVSWECPREKAERRERRLISPTSSLETSGSRKQVRPGLIRA